MTAKSDTEQVIDLPDPATAVVKIRALVVGVIEHYGKLPDTLCVSYVQACELKCCRYMDTDRSVFDVCENVCAGFGVKLVVLEPVRVVATYEATVALPEVPACVTKVFNEAWGYVDGEVSREPATPSEPLAYGLTLGSLVPTKWPEPPGFSHASWLCSGSQRQRVVIEVLSDGTRRIAGAETPCA